MKKILTVLLIAVMAAGFVFASVTGYAQMDAKYDTKTGEFGFVPETALNVKYTLGETAAKAGEGDVYATVDADAQFYLQNAYADSMLAEAVKDTTLAAYTFKLNPSVTAKVVAKDVVVSFSTASSNPVDLAASAVDTYYGVVKDVWGKEILGTWASKAVSLNGGYSKANKTNGFTVDAFGTKAGVNLYKTDKTETAKYELFALTPEFAVNGVTAQAGFTVNCVETEGQISAKVGYAVDAFSATVASDVVIKKGAEKAKFDIAGKVAYDFVSADIYYVSDATMTIAKGCVANTEDVRKKDNDTSKYSKYMSAKVSADLSTFDVPVTVTVTAKNLLNTEGDQAARNFKFAVAYTGVVDATASIQFCAVAENEYVKYTANASYAMDIATVAAGFEGKWTKKGNTATFMPTISATSTTLVNGAEVSLGWYGNVYAPYYDSNKSNLLSGEDFGTIRARIKIAF